MQYRKFLLAATAAAGLAAGGFLLGNRDTGITRNRTTDSAQQGVEENRLVYRISDSDLRPYLPAGYKMTNLYLRDFNGDRRQDAVFTYQRHEYSDSEEEGIGHLTILTSTPSGYKADSRTIVNYPHSEEKNGIHMALAHDGQPELWVDMFGYGNHPDDMTFIFRFSRDGLRQVGSIPNMTRSLGNGTIVGIVERRWDGECMACPQTIVVGNYRWNGREYRLESTQTIPKEIMEYSRRVENALRSGTRPEQIQEAFSAVPQEYRMSLVTSIPDDMGFDIAAATEQMLQQELERQIMVHRVTTDLTLLRTIPVVYLGARIIFNVQRETEAQQYLEGERVRSSVNPSEPNYTTGYMTGSETRRSSGVETTTRTYCIGCTREEAQRRVDERRNAEAWQQVQRDVGAAAGYADDAARRTVQTISSMAQQANSILGSFLNPPRP